MAVPLSILRKFFSGQLSAGALRTFIIPRPRTTPKSVQLSLWVVDADGCRDLALGGSTPISSSTASCSTAI
jgi:hypothetical protein